MPTCKPGESENSPLDTVWLYTESWGEWDDWQERVVGVFTTREKAETAAAGRRNKWGDGTEIHKDITEYRLDTVQKD